ncbi:helicase associated domain-containing protein [Streptomyces filipinensis]
MDTDRAAQPEKLSMVWSHYDVAWEEELAAARGWAAEDGHLLAPTDATYKGYRVGLFLVVRPTEAPQDRSGRAVLLEMLHAGDQRRDTQPLAFRRELLQVAKEVPAPDRTPVLRELARIPSALPATSEPTAVIHVLFRRRVRPRTTPTRVGNTPWPCPRP